ncbi:hypothetical protein ACET3Z_018870 [Daucus carota]
MVNDDKENVHRTPVFRGTPYPATREVLSTIVNNVNRVPAFTPSKGNKLSLSGSILKRTRNNTENNANNETSIPVNVNSSVTPSKKRVRIVTPLEEVAQLKSTSLEKQLIPVYSNQKELCKDGLVGEQFQEYVMKEKTYVEVGKIVEVPKHQIKKSAMITVRTRKRNKKDFEHWLLVRYQPKVLVDAVRWRDQFKELVKDGWKVTANMVCDAIKNSNEADRLFKLNFLVLMYNVLIEGPTNPYVKQNILGFSGNLDNCSSYNWCDYLIENLRNAILAWSEKPDSKYFTGSIPMLVYLYVDRVVNGKRQVRRKKPTFVGWSDSLILDRQISELATGSLKTFFNGRVALPLRSKHSDDESSYEDNTWNIVSAASSDDDEVQCDRNDEHGSFNSVPNVSQAGKDLNQFEILTDGKLSEAHYEKDAGVTLTGNFVQSIGEQKILGKKVPEYVLSELEDSIVGYENIQRKCIMYLLSSKELFSNNNLVDGLQKRFVDLIVKANEFVEKELNIQNYKTLFNNSVLNYVSMRRENTGSSNEKVDAGDGLINFTTKKSVCPDNLVTTNDMVEENKSELFRSMESQSKFLSIQEKCLSNDLKTPGDGRFFKVNLDATIPTFDLGEEFKNQEPNPDSSRVPGLAMQKPERDRKIANIFRSPYIDRITNINGKNFSKEETELWEWLHKNEQYPK